MWPYKETEEYYLKSLKIYEKELGLDHPSTATNYWWLAILSEEKKDYKKTETLYLKTINIYENKLGIEHQNTN